MWRIAPQRQSTCASISLFIGIGTYTFVILIGDEQLCLTRKRVAVPYKKENVNNDTGPLITGRIRDTGVGVGGGRAATCRDLYTKKHIERYIRYSNA